MCTQCLEEATRSGYPVITGHVALLAVLNAQLWLWFLNWLTLLDICWGARLCALCSVYNALHQPTLTCISLRRYELHTRYCRGRGQHSGRYHSSSNIFWNLHVKDPIAMIGSPYPLQIIVSWPPCFPSLGLAAELFHSLNPMCVCVCVLPIEGGFILLLWFCHACSSKFPPNQCGGPRKFWCGSHFSSWCGSGSKLFLARETIKISNCRGLESAISRLWGKGHSWASLLLKVTSVKR